MNVLIVNGYSTRNRGDGMIVNQMIRLFRERGCAVRLMSDDPDDDSRPEVAWVPPLVRRLPFNGHVPSIPEIMARTAVEWVRPGRRHEAMSWADVCVSAGGGYLYDDGSAGSRLNIVSRLLPLRAARHHGLPVVMFSQSVGPFASSPWEQLVARELRRANLVLAREELSMEVCREMGLTRLELCDDVAFALRPDAEAPHPEALDTGVPTVGVTVMNALPGVDDAGHRAYLDALREGLVRAMTGRPERIAVISQVAVHGRDSDTLTATRLADDLRAAGVEARFVDLGEVSDPALSAFYGGLELVVASRLHSGILALCAGTPVLALSYLPKTDGVLARVGFPELVLPAHGLAPDRLASALVDALGARADLRHRLESRLAGLRASAENAVDLTLDTASRAQRLDAATSP